VQLALTSPVGKAASKPACNWHSSHTEESGLQVIKEDNAILAILFPYISSSPADVPSITFWTIALSNTTFCNLKANDFVNANLKDIDFSSDNIDDIKLIGKELDGAIISLVQTMDVIKFLGVKIKEEINE
jgi:uncharacterized protein YjbI with pentapeptide repeats